MFIAIVALNLKYLVDLLMLLMKHVLGDLAFHITSLSYTEIAW